MGKREHIYKIIAENIRKERRRLGITQAELAERAQMYHLELEKNLSEESSLFTLKIVKK